MIARNAMPHRLGILWMVLLLAIASPPLRAADWEGGLRVGAAYAEFEADDDMPIAGGIGPSFADGQEGMLRAVATVIQGPPNGTKVAIVACDILMIEREYLDAAARRIEQETGIPFDNILINCTHTHHAPSTVKIHGYGVVTEFAEHVRDQVVKAVVEANEQLEQRDTRTTMRFSMGAENTVGQNSRLLLEDGTIFWVGPRDDVVRPTGPFDPDFPVLAFRDEEDGTTAILFGHSTHTIGWRSPGKRSPSFYGLAAQQVESETDAVVTFIEGASGSTHNLDLPFVEAERRITNALRYWLDQAQPMPVNRVDAIRREVTVTVREFDEEVEDQKVRNYVEKRIPTGADRTADIFAQMRSELADAQGEQRKTWIQAVRVGDVAIVGVPAEFFTQLGMDIKRRSPFKHTIIASLANDYVGYVGNADAYQLGGYQLWMGHHSWTEVGTGEQFVDTAVELLEELHRE